MSIVHTALCAAGILPENASIVVDKEYDKPSLGMHTLPVSYVSWCSACPTDSKPRMKRIAAVHAFNDSKANYICMMFRLTILVAT